MVLLPPTMVAAEELGAQRPRLTASVRMQLPLPLTAYRLGAQRPRLTTSVRM